ncbi:hypothetical protein RIR_jg10103.t1 [Rhizophagus irregularis DAOM 181602=DAOM 197198]|nr:hypothetical protein RIR_jg10103.t1 [Rhizophagus irregularis DAOM 181602=DAOM 197198]
MFTAPFNILLDFSVPSDCKKTIYSSLESPHRDESNGDSSHQDESNGTSDWISTYFIPLEPPHQDELNGALTMTTSPAPSVINPDIPPPPRPDTSAPSGD